jgi:4-alpha-glucanotransferase
VLQRRSSGVLIHVTSLASPYGIGDLGPTAYRFVDFLHRSGQSAWQVLPLNHTTPRQGHSPYNCYSAFAADPLLISPELLLRDGLLKRRELARPPAFPKDRIDFAKALAYKSSLLDAAFERFDTREHPADYEAFCRDHRDWLEPFTLFAALRRRFKGRPWNAWPVAARDSRKALRDIDTSLHATIERERFLQYVLYRQYGDLRCYCHEKGIQILGDLPIYVTYDSADVWAHPELFKLSADKKPRFIAGVPPDYFSKTGQLWGNPVYNWDRLEQTDFDWWMRRLEHNLRLFDLLRIDHFRGLIAYWQVPAGHKTAMHGKWVPVPNEAFFATLFRRLPHAAIFAEDLGQITADVREVVTRYHLPCMKVLQFAFSGNPARNPHIPHNHIQNAIVYTGTHDNDTARGWFEHEMKGARRSRLFEYLGRKVKASDISWELIRLAMASVAKLAVIPMQDLLELGTEARMNHPAKTKGNWRWRMRDGKLTARLADRLRHLTEIHGRL